LFFSDPLFVSLDSEIFDEVVVRLEKEFFGRSVSWERDLRWTYNDTVTQEDFFELRKAIPRQLADE